MFKILAAAGVAASLLALSASSAAGAVTPTPASSNFTIQVVSASGSGCPAGSAVAASTDGNEFTLTYPSFSTPGGSTGNCVTMVRLGVPAGWTYTISRMVNKGSARLDPDATGKFSMLARFLYFPWSMTASKALDGPYDGGWDALSFAENPIWAPCDSTSHNLIINHTISVVGPTSSSLTLLGSTTGQVDLRQC